MAFELTHVTKHGFIYIIFSYVETEKRLYVLGLLHHTNLHVDVCVIEEMSKLRSNGE
jgi:hypothetical protein